MPMQITEHIHALRIPFEVHLPAGVTLERFVYAFLILGKRVCLIDSGVATAETVIFETLEKAGRKPQEIDLLVLTHSHPDHIGAAKAIREKTGCLVAAHEAEKGWIEDVDLQSRERPVPGFHSLVGGSVPVGRSLADGDEIDLGGGHSLKVLHAPGHSAGSICLLYEKEKALFCADAVPVPGEIPIYEDIAESARTLKRLRALPGVDHLLAAWDSPRQGREVDETIAGGLQTLQRIHTIVTGLAGEGASGDPLELCRKALAAMGLPPALANPLIARSFLSSLKAKDRQNLFTA
jgi:glyoxylase-like metal-dependent hydrolase (beta-lactamase superfamily II)